MQVNITMKYDILRERGKVKVTLLKNDTEKGDA